MNRFTEQAVDYLFGHGCQLIVLACHTASARALRRIQQVWLPAHYPGHRVLGVLIPTVEEAVARTQVKRIGVIATEGTVTSQSFDLELKKLDPEVAVVQQACPLLVPIIESGEQEWEGTTLILRRYLAPFQGPGGHPDPGLHPLFHLKRADRGHPGRRPRTDLLRPGHRRQAGGLSQAPSRDREPLEPGRDPPLPHHRPDAALAQLASLFMGHPLSSEVVELKRVAVVSGQWPVEKTAPVPLKTALFSRNVAPVTAPVPADDYHEAGAEDNSWFNPDVEGSPGAPSLNWLLTTDY